MVPKDQVGGTMSYGGEVFNFGINNQSDVELSMDLSKDGDVIISGETDFTMYSVDADGFYSVVETDGMIDNDESVYFEMMDENPSTEIGMYTMTLLLTLWQKWMDLLILVTIFHLENL